MQQLDISALIESPGLVRCISWYPFDIPNTRDTRLPKLLILDRGTLILLSEKVSVPIEDGARLIIVSKHCLIYNCNSWLEIQVTFEEENEDKTWEVMTLSEHVETFWTPSSAELDGNGFHSLWLYGLNELKAWTSLTSHDTGLTYADSSSDEDAWYRKSLTLTPSFYPLCKCFFPLLRSPWGIDVLNLDCPF